MKWFVLSFACFSLIAVFFVRSNLHQAAPSVIRVLDCHFKRTCHDCAPTIPVDKPAKAIDFIAFRPENMFEVLRHQSIPESMLRIICPCFQY